MAISLEEYSFAQSPKKKPKHHVCQNDACGSFRKNRYPNNCKALNYIDKSNIKECSCFITKEKDGYLREIERSADVTHYMDAVKKYERRYHEKVQNSRRT